MTPRPPTDPRTRAALDAFSGAIAKRVLRRIAETGARDATTPDGDTVGVAAGDTTDGPTVSPAA